MSTAAADASAAWTRAAHPRSFVRKCRCRRCSPTSSTSRQPQAAAARTTWSSRTTRKCPRICTERLSPRPRQSGDTKQLRKCRYQLPASSLQLKGKGRLAARDRPILFLLLGTGDCEVETEYDPPAFRGARVCDALPFVAARPPPLGPLASRFGLALFSAVASSSPSSAGCAFLPRSRSAAARKRPLTPCGFAFAAASVFSASAFGLNSLPTSSIWATSALSPRRYPR